MKKMSKQQERRKENRITKGVILMVDSLGYRDSGVTRNLSRHGMLVMAPMVLPVNSELQVAFTVQDKLIELKGVVIWNCQYIGGFPADQQEMGICFEYPSHEYQLYVDQLR